MQALLCIVTLAALVSNPSSLTGLPHSLAEHAAAMAGNRAILPEISDDDKNCGHLDPRALATTTRIMRESAGRDARFATFAGGCFWGLELALQRTPGVLCTAVGYTQGQTEFPSYAEVCTEATGHTEAVLVLYDRATVSYAALCELLFERIGDPTMLNRVGRDQGTQYRTGMYFHSKSQAAEARLAHKREVTVLRRQTRRLLSRYVCVCRSRPPCRPCPSLAVRRSPLESNNPRIGHWMEELRPRGSHRGASGRHLLAGGGGAPALPGQGQWPIWQAPVYRKGCDGADPVLWVRNI